MSAEHAPLPLEDEIQESNPWESDIESPSSNTPSEETAQDSPNKYHRRGSQAVERFAGMLADATEGPREAAKSKLRKLGRGALSAVKSVIRTVGYAPLTAIGAGIAAGETYVSNVKSNINTVGNLATSGANYAADAIDDQIDTISFRYENTRDSLKDMPNKTKRGLGALALGFQGIRAGRQEKAIAKYEQQLAKSREKLNTINQGSLGIKENISNRQEKSAAVRTEAIKRATEAQARQDERERQRAEMIELGKGA